MSRHLGEPSWRLAPKGPSWLTAIEVQMPIDLSREMHKSPHAFVGKDRTNMEGPPMRGSRLLSALGVAAILVASSCTSATPSPSTPAQSPAAGQPTPAAGQPTPAGSQGAESPHKFAMLMATGQSKRVSAADFAEFEKAANAAGYKAVLQLAEFNPATQLSQAENALSEGINVLVLQPVDPTTSATIVTKAAALGVPVISYNDLARNADIAAFVGRDATDGGKSAATEVLKARPKGNYVLVGGDQAASVAQNMQKGFHEILDPEVAKGNIKIVSDQFTPGWKTEPALAQVENALTSTGDKIDVVLTAYDGMAMGVLQAVAARNLPKGQVLITGQDMELPMAQAMAEGRAFGTVWAEFGQMGKRAAETAIALAEGKEFASDTTVNNGAKDVPWVKVPTYLVTVDQLGTFLCEHQWWLTIDEVYKNVPAASRPSC